jgi:hypothetical protein
MMHSLTIELMAREGVDSLRHKAQESSDEGEAQESSDGEESFNEAGEGTCPSCSGTGEVGQVCTLCEDESIYLNFHAGL